MNYFTVILFSAFLIGLFVFYVLKSHYVNKLAKGIDNQEYQKVIELSQKPFINKILSSYVCDLYRLRAYTFISQDSAFKKELMSVIDKEYPYEKQQQLLELYFHYFLLRQDREYAEILLDKIKDMGEPAFYTVSHQAFQVMIEKKSDLIDAMTDAINAKTLKGFTLGMIVYMIGMQYLYLDNKEEARTYFYNSLACFNKHAIYVNSAKKKVQELSDELGLAYPNY